MANKHTNILYSLCENIGIKLQLLKHILLLYQYRPLIRLPLQIEDTVHSLQMQSETNIHPTLILILNYLQHVFLLTIIKKHCDNAAMHNLKYHEVIKLPGTQELVCELCSRNSTLPSCLTSIYIFKIW